MGQVKKLLIFIGKPGYWLVLLFTKIISIAGPKINQFKKRTNKEITKLHQKIKSKTKKTSKQISLPFPETKINKELLAVILMITGTIIITTSFIIDIFQDMPRPNQLVERPPALTTRLYDRNNQPLYKIYKEENRTLVHLEDIPDHLIKATLAIEDKDFFNHSGLSWRGILRAVYHNTFNAEDSLIGGSTITQQLIKNALLTPDKTWQRKIREAILSVWVEKTFTKDEILQMYFNEVPYGGMVYGVEEASQKYFDKHVWELNPAESAFLAGLTRAPTTFSPFGSHPERAKQRQQLVIAEMVRAEFITPKEGEEINDIPLRFNIRRDSIRAPHFVFYVKDWLIQRFGRELVEAGGLKVTTTLDLDIHQTAQSIVSQEINKLQGLRITNGASLVVDPKLGQILAMVGSKDYFDFNNDGNVNVTIRPRQPGSAIKPVNYAVALSKGYTAATILSDSRITYRGPGQRPYSPVNYGGQYFGRMPLRTALGSSLNIPAVKVLSSYGLSPMIDMAENLGITTWEDRSRFGLSLTLGGGEVTMVDLSQAFSVLANLGSKVDFSPVLEVKNHQGETIYQHHCLNQLRCTSEKVLDPGIAFILNDILADDIARQPVFGHGSLLNIPGHKVAVKTGTTNNMRDNWCFGYTPNILVASWVGNNDNTSMSYVASGITGATPIWQRTMTKLLENQKQSEWNKPENVVHLPICRSTATLPCSGCPQIVNEYFIKGTEPEEHCFFEIEIEENGHQIFSAISQ